MRSAVTGRNLPLLGGALCLDFVNTIDPRHKSPREDFLESFDDFIEWGHFVGELSAAERRALKTAGKADAAFAADVHARALSLRDALFALLSGKKAASEALGVLNRELERTASYLALARGADGYLLAWHDCPSADRLLGSITRSASELMTSSEFALVRECAGNGCGWLFLDTSKAHQRRWCSMAVCGNRAKSQRHRQRVSATEDSL